MTFEQQALHEQISGTLEGLDILREAGDLRRAREASELAEAKARARLRPVYLTPTSDDYQIWNPAYNRTVNLPDLT